MGFKYWLEAGFVACGIALLAFNYYFISDILPFIIPVVNIIAGLVIIIPPTLLFYTKYRIRKESEKNFISFLMDLSDSLNSGMTLPLALKETSRRNYMSLTRPVRKLAAQVDWGIPFDRALQKFAKKTYSPFIERTVTTITETYRMGGKLSDTLQSAIKSALTLDKINEERRSAVYSQTLITYIIFFVFIAILVVIDVSIIPALSSMQSSLSSGGFVAPIPKEEMEMMLSYLIVIQGFFSGLVTGKMAEGSVLAGIKHSILLSLLGYGIFAMASQIQIPFLSMIF